MNGGQNKSIKINTIIFACKRVLNVIFPMITMPYALRTLGVENIGRYNFVLSIIGYFSLIGALGLTDYARRDGAMIRSDRKKMSEFGSEVFSFQIFIVGIAYLLLFICTLSAPYLRKDALLVFLCSLSIFLTAIGVEWVFNIYEDYLYITLRQVVTQILSMAMLFLLVRDRDDLLHYAFISIIASAGSNIFNFIYARKYCDLRLVFHIDWGRHLKKSIIFFANSLMITIYVNTDQTLLGFLCGDYSVGLYSTGVKIYSVVGGILVAAVVIGISRLSEFVGNGNLESFYQTASEIYRMVLTITFPTVIGLCVFSKEAVYLVGGSEYLEAATSMFILSIGLYCFVMAVYWGQCVLVPNGKEKALLYITAVSAGINFVLNLIFIPFFKQEAAAFTTMLSEGFTGLMAYIYGRRMVTLYGVSSVVRKSLIGSGFVLAAAIVMKRVTAGTIPELFLSIFLCASGYFVIEYWLKNEVIYNSVKSAVIWLNKNIKR
ncbi:oligosaccharide flippase family protein [Lachnospiraceae bacterium WCA-9-b2]|jgi:Membrane protein involved in the export of O-antigen and teichoic acid|uniref:Oligosaccharide flippase family protein n=1 Tax=Sporofaciens musculi TaxID=2681861 RepID=A0A7X3SJX0_9FIRM|nr:flippase [Sporofaciens musculi]MXP76795.1 oligosaccharide flippase family protein [Sporofaciens musculi]